MRTVDFGGSGTTSVEAERGATVRPVSRQTLPLGGPVVVTRTCL